ncbi:hypothetical protein JF50_12010 [Pseudoalteromonas luteoviolacea]|uniref:FAD-binding PCMH-type domain-containing protein n=1 Tax=Pseudoalteromonas luteoviolacea TaxID=43657 RepID=A0A0C1Q7H6_9GAMM|nr:FAD-dependent oxidoreductase [Pseudoalteromonas luteoviolacea]KID56646.1 hypothetical protein JF50_12010 [Pseudoalteromonas luteoviolacea]
MFLTQCQKKKIESFVDKGNVLYPNDDFNNLKSQYNRSRRVFNRKFDFVPSAVVQVTSTEEVSELIAYLQKEGIDLTVKSGGHDHEGECVATGKVLIDFECMSQVDVSKNKSLVRIQPGAKFVSIKEELDKHNLGIPHGTCMTVAIAGYTMGGGWGPWTRRYGMGCERLIGATIVLGDGSIEYLGQSATHHNKDQSAHNSQLLSALRGGGGLSYGIVTEFFFEPFELPEIAQSFVIKRDTLPALENIKATTIIAAWEHLIANDKNHNLIGTNLKVDAKAVACASEISQDAVLDWQMNGHFGGTIEERDALLAAWAKIVGLTGGQSSQLTASNSLSELYNKVNADAQVHSSASNAGGYALNFDSWDRSTGIELETDGPAPHKITSRMPTSGWDEQGREALVKSLQSTLLFDQNSKSTVSAYITLGAISGPYYTNKLKAPLNERVPCAFPYQDRPFTIQYQAWWDQPDKNKPVSKEQEIATRFYENRAQDWIESCRSYDIPHTYGSFISFKDASVETKDYFVDKYEELINTKLECSRDDKCLLRSRKTII